MVQVKVVESTCIFQVLGIHRILCFRSRIVIPLAHIVRAYPHDVAKRFYGWRLLGISIPWLLNAGIFMRDGKRYFLDIRGAHQAIVVELRNQWFDKLLIEVKDPTHVLTLLNGNQLKG